MASLLTVTGGRLELKRDHSYVLGRAADCDVVLHDIACSRHHARLDVGGTDEGITIQDLGSHNGTYVDDHRIARTTHLRNHSRVRTGSTIFLLSLVDAGAEPGPEWDDPGDGHEMTISFDRRSAGPARAAGAPERSPGFAGQIGVFNVFEILSFLTGSRRSGALHIAFDTGQGRIDLREGEVWGAAFGEDIEGPEALEALVRRKAGLFWLLDDASPCPRTVHVPSSQLLASLFRVLNES